MALAKGQNVSDKSRKPAYKPKEPDVFKGENTESLRTFIFQCEVYFNARKREFEDPTDRVNFAISYLRGPALAYFEPYFTNSDTAHDFFVSWPAFTQKLHNQFGSYSPEDDDEDAITSIAFPNDGKATQYFIDFARYQTRISWDERALRKVVKDAIPPRITDELRYSREDTSTFEGFKRAVLKIDNDYWKKKQDDANKQRLVQTLQSRLSRTSKESKSSNSSSKDNNNSSTGSNVTLTPSSNASQNNPNSKNKKGKGKNKNRNNNSNSTPQSSIVASHLGPDGKLTATEKQRRMDNKLCVICADPGHIAVNCPKKKNNYPPSSNNSKARATKVEPEAGSSQPKN